MRAAVVTQVGEPPRPSEMEPPARGDGRALVEVRAAALNPIEVRVAAGRFERTPQVPYVPGLEGTGTVLEADGVPAGTRVRFEAHLPGFGSNGALAEVAAAEAESLVELPDEADDAVAAALGVVGITAWMALERGHLREGEAVLVLGATGAVGQAALQLAKLAGAGRVVAAGRSAERLRRAEELGADATVELTADGLTDAVREAAGGGVDLVVDPLWGAPAMAALGAATPGGRLVNVGQAAGTGVELPLAAIRNRGLSIIGLSSGWAPLEVKRAAYRRVLEHAVAGRLVVDHEVVPLDDVAAAWERQAASPGAKLVIRP